MPRELWDVEEKKYGRFFLKNKGKDEIMKGRLNFWKNLGRGKKKKGKKKRWDLLGE